MTENLKRIEAKIFAGNADASKVGQFGSALIGTKVNTTDINTIQQLPAYTVGWSSAVISNRNYPTIEEMNGVMKVLSYQTAYNMQKGVAEWDAQTTYYAGDICKGIGTGILYVSRSDNNIANEPGDTTYWSEYQGSSLNLPATNYIAEMGGDITYSGNVLNLPAMTLYIPDGLNSDKTIKSKVVSVAANSFTLSGSGEYNIFYNADANNLLLAVNYTKKDERIPDIIIQNDVHYRDDNFMYFVDTNFPNYTISEGVTVNQGGIVSNLGTLALNAEWDIGANPVFNIKFATGTDITTSQSLFNLPFADAKVENGQVEVSLYSYAYAVNYYSTLYSGSYALADSKLTYNYQIGKYGTVYTIQPFTQGLTVFSDEAMISEFGTITSLTNENVVISEIQTVYDGEFSLESSGSYYTYNLGDGQFYTSSELAKDVVVYNDTELSEVFGIVQSVNGSTVLIQSIDEIYNGTYTENPVIALYTYTAGEQTLYSSHPIVQGVELYTDNTLNTVYGSVQSVSEGTLVIQSTEQINGFVSANGSGNVAENIIIYADILLTEEVAISNGANAVYNGGFQKARIGGISYDVEASTDYIGNLAFNGLNYTLTLNSTSSSFISERLPYSNTSSVVLGGEQAFLGTFDLNSVNIPDVWTWNGFYVDTPNWEKAALGNLGTVLIINGQIQDLHIHRPLELAKFSDIEYLADTNLVNTKKLSDGILSFINPLKYTQTNDSAILTLPAAYNVLFANGLNIDNTLKSVREITNTDLKLTITHKDEVENIIYLQYLNKTLGLNYVPASYFKEQDIAPTDATTKGVTYIWHSRAQNTWYYGNSTNGWTKFLAVKVGRFTGSTDLFINNLTVENPVSIAKEADVIHASGGTMTGVLEFSDSISDTAVQVINTGIDVTSKPTASKYKSIRFKDAAGNDIGNLQVRHTTAGKTSLAINIRDNSTNVFNGLYAETDNAGHSYGIAPTPANNNDSTQIATTAFVSNMLTTSNSNFIAFLKTAVPYLLFANGFMFQSGDYTSTQDNVSKTITFPRAFSTRCRVVVCRQSASDTNGPVDVPWVQGDPGKGSFKVRFPHATAVAWFAFGH